MRPWNVTSHDSQHARERRAPLGRTETCVSVTVVCGGEQGRLPVGGLAVRSRVLFTRLSNVSGYCQLSLKSMCFSGCDFIECVCVFFPSSLLLLYYFLSSHISLRRGRRPRRGCRGSRRRRCARRTRRWRQHWQFIPGEEWLLLLTVFYLVLPFFKWVQSSQ